MTRDEESKFLAAGAADLGIALNPPQCELAAAAGG